MADVLMAKAMRYPTGKIGGKRVKGSGLETKPAFSKGRLSHARTVLNHWGWREMTRGEMLEGWALWGALVAMMLIGWWFWF
jgi:hypothetical protein